MAKIFSYRKNIKLRFKDYVFMALAAIELLMSFTFLGYLHIEPISITYAYIPVVIAARFLGIWQAAAIGAIFGLSSMFKASAYYVMPLDRIFSPVGSPSPISSILLSVGTRILFGLLMGLIFHLLRNQKYYRLWTDLICFLAPKFHGSLVYIALGLLFPEYGYSVSNTFVLNASDIVASLLCILSIEVVRGIWNRPSVQDFYMYVEKADTVPDCHACHLFYYGSVSAFSVQVSGLQGIFGRSGWFDWYYEPKNVLKPL